MVQAATAQMTKTAIHQESLTVKNSQEKQKTLPKRHPKQKNLKKQKTKNQNPAETVLTEAKAIPLHVWILILVAGLGTAYMIFWIRAQHYYRRRMAK